MPSVKHKTHKGLKKRFKVTGTGKVLHKVSGSSHLNSGKNGKQIRHLRKTGVVRVNKVARLFRVALGASTPKPRSRPAPADVEVQASEDAS